MGFFYGQFIFACVQLILINVSLAFWFEHADFEKESTTVNFPETVSSNSGAVR